MLMNMYLEFKFHAFETNLMHAILLNLHIYLIILSDLCLEFMQIGGTPLNVDDVFYLGQIFNVVQV
jgi:hypothetical protein